jgi:hypothetical protein
MGQRAIERGSTDTWTPSPGRINALKGNDQAAWESLRKPEWRDPRAFIIPSDQPDFLTAIKFINALREVNVTVHRATSSFELNGKNYPAGSFVVFTAQAFRPHVMDMFEPQDHPNVIPYPGAPPTPPYDNAGWTLAFQMGVQFDRILEPFEGPFEKVTDWNVAPPMTSFTRRAGALTLDRRQNDAIVGLNRLLKAGVKVVGHSQDTFYLSADRSVPEAVAKLGVRMTFTDAIESRGTIRTPRIGLWDQYGGSMPSGWTRWILEQFEFPFNRVFASELDAGNLNTKYDVLIFVNGAIPAVSQPPQAGGRSGQPGGQGRGGGGRGGGRGGAPLNPEDVPAEFRSHLGRMTVEQTIPQLRAFVEAGGTLIAIGSSAENIVRHFNLPLEDHLVEDGKPIPRARHFVPGSVLEAAVDTKHAAAAGMPARVNFFFDNSPVFKLAAGANENVRVIARFDSETPLKSGWAWGQNYLNGGIAAAEVVVGKGRVYLYGPEILHRAQPHGTFKLFFNALLESTSTR